MFGDPCTDGRGDHTPTQQGDDEIEPIPIEREKKGDGDGEGDEELGRIGGTDGVARRNPTSNQRGGRHRPPASTTDCIEKTRDPTQRMTGRARESGFTA